MPENTERPADSATPLPGKPKRRVWILAVLIVGLVLIAGLSIVRSGVFALRRIQCIVSTHQIVLALHSYEEEHGTLPPAYTVDAEGNRLHSWRTLILPYMGNMQHVYDQIDLTKAWDDPANARARELVFEEFRCQGTSLGDKRLTTYLAVVGPECVFTGPNGRPFKDVSGSHASTIAIIDAPQEHAVHWMSPEDITIDEVLSISAESELQHNEVFIVGFLDGHADPVELQIHRDVLRAMLTVADDGPSE